MPVIAVLAVSARVSVLPRRVILLALPAVRSAPLLMASASSAFSRISPAPDAAGTVTRLPVTMMSPPLPLA